MSPNQRSLFKNYYSGVLGIRDHGIAAGAAAAGVAGTAVSSVAEGLANGDTGNIDAEVRASKAKVEAQAESVCRDLAQSYAAQQTLATQLDAFKAYAVIKADEPDDCLHNIKGNSRDT